MPIMAGRANMRGIEDRRSAVFLLYAEGSEKRRAQRQTRRQLRRRATAMQQRLDERGQRRVNNATPSKSSGRGTASRVSATSRGTPHATNAQAGRLMRKIQRQPIHEETSPPIVVRHRMPSRRRT